MIGAVRGEDFMHCRPSSNVAVAPYFAPRANSDVLPKFVEMKNPVAK